VHQAYPDKEIHFTECSGGDWAPDFSSNLAWNTINLYIGSVQYWARSVMHWNLALDANNGPTNGGCTNCRGVVTIRNDNTASYNVEYYGSGHFSKFLKHPSNRISTAVTGNNCINGISFKNGDGSVVSVVANLCSSTQQVAVQNGNQYVLYNVEVGLTSFIWP